MEVKDKIRSAIKSELIKTSFGDLSHLRNIGEGGNGLVYACTLLDKKIAVKFLCDEGNAKLGRFKAEYLNVALLENNVFVAKTLFYEEIEIDTIHVPCIAMKLYGGALKRPNSADLVDAAKKLFSFLLNSLEFIHQNGIIHRDLKPQNILLAEDGYRLADFGIAKFNPDNFFIMAETKEGERLANYLFSAPEQLVKGGVVGPWSDIYAMGQIIQWFVTGQPHRGTQRQNFGEELNELDKIVRRCLAHNVEKRFQTTEEIRDFIKHERQRITSPDPWVALHSFGNVLARTFPKVARGFFYSDDSEVINRFFDNLNGETFADSLAWVDGLRSSEFEKKIVRIDRNIWLLGNTEFNVQRIYGYVSDATYGNLVFLELGAIEAFDSAKILSGQLFDSIGLINGTEHISIDELFNGYAEIDGKVVDLATIPHEERMRYLQSGVVAICTTAHNIYLLENEDYLLKFIEGATVGASVENLKPQVNVLFNSIRRNMREDVRRYL